MIHRLRQQGNQKVADAPDDARIVADVIAGDREAYSILVRRYQETLFRFAHGMVGNADVASDLLQESFVKAYTTLERCREPDRFGAWLHRILRNRCLDYLKRQRRHQPLEAVAVQLVRDPDAEDALDRRELRAALADALSRLPEAQREAFLMKHLEDRPYEEIAEMLNTSVSALKMRVKRAREAMRAVLSEAAVVTQTGHRSSSS